MNLSVATKRVDVFCPQKILLEKMNEVNEDVFKLDLKKRGVWIYAFWLQPSCR